MPGMNSEGNLIDLKSKGPNLLSNVSVSNVETTKGVAQTMYTFLRYLDSEDENWRKLKSRLNDCMPSFIQKVQVAFIYYFAKNLELRFLKTNEDAKTPKKLEDMAKYLVNCIEHQDDMYRYFEQLFDSNSSNHAAVATNELVSNFLSDTVQMKGKLLGYSSDINLTTDTITMEEFFENLDSLLQKSSEPGAFFPTVFKTTSLQDPVKAASGQLIAFISGLSVAGGTMRGLSKDGKLKSTINSIEDPATRKAFENYLERHIDDEITTETAKDLYDDFIKSVNPANLKAKQKTEAIEKANMDAYTNAVALNVANFISGKISTEDFIARDQEIRTEKDQPLNENDTETILM